MMLKKRGSLLVIVLIILSLFTVIVGGEDPPTPAAFQMLRIVEDHEEDDPDANSDINAYCTDLAACRDIPSGSVCRGDDDDDYDAGEFPELWPPASAGCYISMNEIDGGFDDDCGWIVVSSGTNVDNNYQSFRATTIESHDESETDGGGEDIWKGIRHDMSFRFRGNQGVVCSDDRLWYQCDQDVIDQVISAGGKIFQCSFISEDDPYGGTVWKELGVDNDHDGYAALDDCDDNFEDDAEMCPTYADVVASLEGAPLASTDMQGLRDVAKSLCNYPQHSQCAICINPGAPEVCGDGSNNDCRAQTSDKCHENKASCEQRPIGYCSDDPNVLCYDHSVCAAEDVGECTVVPEGEAGYGFCEKSGETCSEENPCGEGDTCNPVPQDEALNIYNEQFSWIDLQEGGGYCCGYNGIDDVGTVAKNSDAESFVCLSRNDDLVSTEKGFPDQEGGNAIGIDEIFSNNGCDGQWCWLDPEGANIQFKVFTIKKPGLQPYDVVSNKDDWLTCNAETAPEEKTFAAGPISDDFLKAHSNRFYCYSEGDRWNWAECAGTWDARDNPSIKGRYPGEGLYTLPLSIIQSPDLPPDAPEKDNDYLRETLSGPTVSITYDSLYKKYYGHGFLDFTGYTDLNLMVRFVDEEDNPAKVENLKLPLRIELEIVGPKDEDIVYLKREILGDIINTPFSDINNKEVTEGFMHIQVPIKEYKAVRGITLTANDGNLIQVRNVYLTSDVSDENNFLCSGKDAQDENNWLQDLDSGNPDQEVTGEDICISLYGEEAWLGSDHEVDELQPAANCCGNAKNEYYAGLSKGIVNEEVSSEAAYYGCWNSQPIASGDTIMDVEFEVESRETEFEINYGSLVVSSVGVTYLTIDEKDPLISTDDIVTTGFIPCSSVNTIISPGQNFLKICEFNLVDLPSNFTGITRLWFLDRLVADSPLEIFFYDLITGNPIGLETDYNTATEGIAEVPPPANELDDFDPGVVVPDSSSSKVQFLSAAAAEDVWGHPLAVAIRLRKNHYFPIEKGDPVITTTTNTVTYACSETECLFPLPGNPPYKVTNLHPDLYELYYVTGTLAADEKPVDDQPFPEYANLRVKRIAQQVLFHNEEESTRDIGFYGCRAADFIENNPLVSDYFENLQYCAVIDDKFCSYSEVFKEDKNKDEFTVVNTWSDEDLTKVGYDTSALPDPESLNISAYYEQVELTLKDQLKLASSRNQSTAVLPARNFISNAEFSTSATKLPYWEVLVNNQARADEKTGFVQDHKFTLSGANEKLRSERIPVPSNQELHFSTAQECTTDISLVDKDGNSEAASLPQFNSGEASYVIIEFTGPCEVEKPLLQVVGDSGPVEYSYQSHPELPFPDARSGAACCPDNYCWNGYACVEPMGSLTTVSEHVGDGQDYRCIDGQWKESELKFDWNNQQWGFCPQESQCFVLGSGKAENTAQSFYQGQYPICVNNSEYIFDNYCTQGNWTSRTKFLATKLLEVAENDEYVLYCSPYSESLLEVEGTENYLGGEFLVTQQQQQSLSQSLQNQPPKVLPTCFNTIKDPEGKRLVPDDQNTCINNVCVLQYKDGGSFKVAFATTLNKEIDDPQSFLVSLNIPQDEVGQICQQGGSDFVNCDLSGLQFSDSTDLLYSDDLNAVIYARDGIQLSPGVVDNILNWFADLFGAGALAEKTFVKEAQNFRNLYIADIDGKKVRATEEIFPGVRQSLVAEYEDFDTPICEYVKNIKVPPELQLELLEQASGIEKVHCAVNDSIQKVVVNAGLDFFWPQLTGKLRIGEMN